MAKDLYFGEQAQRGYISDMDTFMLTWVPRLTSLMVALYYGSIPAFCTLVLTAGFVPLAIVVWFVSGYLIARFFERSFAKDLERREEELLERRRGKRQLP